MTHAAEPIRAPCQYADRCTTISVAIRESLALEMFHRRPYEAVTSVTRVRRRLTGGWGLASGGTVGSVVVVDVPDAEGLAAGVFALPDAGLEEFFGQYAVVALDLAVVPWRVSGDALGREALRPLAVRPHTVIERERPIGGELAVLFVAVLPLVPAPLHLPDGVELS